MENRSEKIFSHTDCPGEEFLNKYSEGSLTPQEQNYVERHLLDCGMCSDYVEGLSAVKELHYASSIKEELEEEINKRISEDRKGRGIMIGLNNWEKIAAAASVILLLGLYSLLNNYFSGQDKNIIVQNVQKNIALDNRKETAGTITETKIIQFTPPVVSGDMFNPAVAGESAEGTGITILQNMVLADVVEGPKDENKNAPAIMMDMKTLEEKTVDQSGKDLNKEQNEVLATAEIPKSDVAGNSVEYKDEVSKNEKKEKDKDAAAGYADGVAPSGEKAGKDVSLDDAMSEYNNGKYKDALSKFESVLKQSPEDYSALYYSARCYMELGKYSKSVTNFNKVLNVSGGKYYESAKFNKAKSLLSKGEKEKAKAVLTEIINEGGKYKDEATEMMNKM